MAWIDRFSSAAGIGLANSALITAESFLAKLMFNNPGKITTSVEGDAAALALFVGYAAILNFFIGKESFKRDFFGASLGHGIPAATALVLIGGLNSEPEMSSMLLEENASGNHIIQAAFE